MKRFLSITLSLVFVVTAFAQQKDVTKFLGIPVDGTKAEIIEKLKAKGFTPKYIGDELALKGEFNGHDVIVVVVTNNNKVYRIFVRDANPKDEADIKIRFNKLVRQFEWNNRYNPYKEKQEIADDEKIGYEMLVNHKVYEASFMQKPDTVIIKQQVRERMLEKYTDEQLQNPTEEMNNMAGLYKSIIELGSIANKNVWFRIEGGGDRFYIVMYYDNGYNQANGEDL